MVEILLQTPRSAAILQAIGSADMVAPDFINVEVLSVLRRLVLRRMLTVARAEQALEDLRDAPVRRLVTLPLLVRAWGLRDSLSAYDACYVALASTLHCPLVTGDMRLARAPGLPVAVIVP